MLMNFVPPAALRDLFAEKVALIDRRSAIFYPQSAQRLSDLLSALSLLGLPTPNKPNLKVRVKLLVF